MGLKFSYTLLAPLYDTIVASSTQSMRSDSIARLHQQEAQHILINGVGTGLDIPHLPKHHHYTGTDLTPAMLKKCQSRLSQFPLNLKLISADVMQLPFDKAVFDQVLMHLILAVVPSPLLALQEASRVLKPGGQILILDKFLRPGQLAPGRRLLNIFMRHIATRTDVVFEHLLPNCPELKVIEDRPAKFGGWFRLITLEKIS